MRRNNLIDQGRDEARNCRTGNVESLLSGDWLDDRLAGVELQNWKSRRFESSHRQNSLGDPSEFELASFCIIERYQGRPTTSGLNDRFAHPYTSTTHRARSLFEVVLTIGGVAHAS